MKVTPIQTRIFHPKEDLFDFITEWIDSIPQQSVLVITSKIIALAEGRIIEIESDEHREQIIKQESDYAFKHPYGWLSIVDGIMTGSGGLDNSNVEETGKQIMLPKDCFASAELLRKQLMAQYNLSELGIIITDSRIMPLRKGTLGAAFGYAGFKATKSYVGTEDLFGRKFERQKKNIPDALATAAVFTMGEGAEQSPLCLIEDANIEFTNDPVDPKELVIDKEDDIYKFFYQSFE